MEIIVAKTAGFCFGVNKAVTTVYDLLGDKDNPIYTFGPIIHNEQVVNELKDKGVTVINDPIELNGSGNIVIRAHGVTPKIFKEISSKKVKVTDATCPYVKKIHNLVREKFDEGYQIVIIGDKRHPEVVGINGWCENTAIILCSIEEAEKLDSDEKKVCVVAQTTITNEKWENINEILKKKFENIIKFDTICSATSRRQNEAESISRKVDIMLVLGSSNSSNTQKLFEICKKYCSNTHYIETSGDIPPVDIKTIKKIGITAGASTPEWVIKEVLLKMEELNKQEDEMSFKEAFESFSVRLESGKTAKGKIIGYNNSEVFVDLGYKSDGIIPISEFSDDPDFKPETALKAGDEIEVYIIRVNDGEGNVLLSKKKVDSLKGYSDIEEAHESKATVKAKVVDVVNGGIIAIANGVRIFVPASQISDRYIKDLKEFIKSDINVRIIEFDRHKRKIVGSAKILLQEEKAIAANEFWGKVEIGSKYTGTVKSLTDFGAFVDIGGVDGLIHISELSWGKVNHPSEVLKIGDQVDVCILNFDHEKGRISLGYKKAQDNPWHNAEEKFAVGSVVKGKVVRLVPFGAFVELEPGVDALVHISQISSVRIAKPGDVLTVGQEIEAKVTELNTQDKKIGLSIKEINPIDPPNLKKDEETEGSAEEEIPTEHKEEMSVKIELPVDVINENV